MSSLKLMFLINGSQGSAASIRAAMFAHSLPKEWNIEFNYRSKFKLKDILSFIRSVLQFQPSIVYVMDTAYTGVLAGSISKQLTGCKLITDSGDVTFELAKSEGIYSDTQLGLIKWIEQLAIKNSDCLVVRGSYHKKLLEQQGSSKVVFIPDGVDIDKLDPVDGNSIKTELGLSNYLVVGLVGSMIWSQKHQMCYGWDIIEALQHLKDFPIKALLVGDGNGFSRLKERAISLGVYDRVIFTGRIPYYELSRYISAMDVCVSTQSNDLVGMVRTTGKLPLYLAFGKYVIATDVGEASNVLPGVGCLLPYTGVRDNDHPKRLAQHLKELLETRKHESVSKAAKTLARNNFHYSVLTERVKVICEELTQS